MTDTRNNPPGDRSVASSHSQASPTGHSHLAHWPPPQRGHEIRPVLVKHQANEPAQQAKPHGLSLTRSGFKDDGDE